MSKKARRFLLILAAMLTLAIFVGFQILREYQKLQALNEEKAVVSAQLDAKETENEELAQSIEDSKNESFIERMARELLGWVKPGEIKIVDKEN